MTTTLTLFGTYISFALWQSTLWLAIVLLCGRLYRRTPWKAHVWYTTGIIAATLTPLLSTIVFTTGGGVLESFPSTVIPAQAGIQTNDFSERVGMLCLIGTTLFALILLYGIAASRKLMFHATPFPDRESQEALLHHSKMLRNVSLPILFTSPSVKSPTVWCWGLHPAVLLPEALAEGLRHEQRDAVFLHELSHIIRRDHLTALFARLCGAALFWNPLYWLVLWQNDFAADESCDLVVLDRGNIPPQQYSDTLLRLVAGERSLPILHFLSRKEKIMKRIERITSFVPSPASTGTQLWTASVFTTALFLCVALAFCQEGKQVTTNEAGEFTTETGVRGTVTVDGKPLAGATVTIAPRESATASPERIRSYTVGSRVTDFPAGTIDLLTPEAAYALGNRIIADDNADKIERLRHYTAGMSVPQDIERWITSMTPNVRSSLMNAEILHVFIYRDKHAMVIAEVVKGESYNNRLFSKRDGHWFNTGGSGLFGGKSAEAVVEMLEGHFARLADGWDREPRESATASPQSGDTVLGSQTPDAEASWRAIHSPEHLRDLQGIGAAMRMEDGHLIVENVIPGSSAYVSGEIKQGDRIQGIGQGREGAILNVSGLQMPDAVQLIRGNRGTIVRLEILPKGEDTSKIVELVRDSIPTTIPPLRDSVPTTLPPPDGGFVTDGGPGVSGFTHMVVFQPTGNFNPQNPMQFLALFRERLIARGPVTGYFRTKPVNGKLVGSLLTGDPVGLEQFITSYPELEFVRSERLTKESFEAYEKTPQLSLSPADGG